MRICSWPAHRLLFAPVAILVLASAATSRQSPAGFQTPAVSTPGPRLSTTQLAKETSPDLVTITGSVSQGRGERVLRRSRASWAQADSDDHGRRCRLLAPG
jgi:hypothetical protein